MTTCLIAFALALVLAMLATRAVIFTGLRLGLVDRADEYRKLHVREVPRMGGVGIFIAAVLPIVLLYFGWSNNLLSIALHDRFSMALLGLLSGAVIVTLMGLYDDLFSLLARYKLLFQAIAAIIAFQTGFAINTVQIPYAGEIELGLWSFPLTMFWYLGCMNAVNLLDGLDGLAAGVCLLTAVTMFLVSLVFQNVLSMLLTAALSGALLGFLVYNFHPAKIFLGDSGSMLLGFLLASFGIFASTTAETAVSIVIPVIALGLPILDTSIVIARRWSQKLPLSAPDRRHIHHRLLAMGLSHKRAVLMLYFLCIIFGCAALLLTIQRNEITLMVIGSLAIIIFVCVRVFGGLRLRSLTDKVSSSLRTGKQDANARVGVEQVSYRMTTAKTVDRLWSMCEQAWEAMSLDYATLSVVDRNGAEQTLRVWPEFDHDTIDDLPIDEFDHWAARIKLKDPEGRILGELKVAKTLHDEMMLSVVPELLDRMRSDIAENLVRILDGRAEGAAPAAADTQRDLIEPSTKKAEA